jgi:ADP-ribosylglycohydrolase
VGKSTIPFAAYRRKVLGCWLGKAVGGTLGGPYEGRPGPLALSYYDPVPTEMLPNDDLDLQVVWLEAVRRAGLPVDRRMLADAWLAHNHCCPDEYGVCRRNLTRGIYPAASGSYDNAFTAGMGAAIRTELWACLAPGDPELAARLAYEDACLDHAAEGVHAAVYLATLESAAFVESDRNALLDLAGAAIPEDSRVFRAVAEARVGYEESRDWLAARERILARHAVENWTDVAVNLAFTVLGWLSGERDFGRSICTAVNCGSDTDCTGATLGALMGIIDPDCIGERWLAPIGRSLVLSPSMRGMHNAGTLDEFTDQVAAMAIETLGYYRSAVRLTRAPALRSERAGMAAPRLANWRALPSREADDPHRALLATTPLVVMLTYPPGVALEPGRPGKYRLELANPTRRPLRVRAALRAPDGWELSRRGWAGSHRPGATARAELEITAPVGQPRPYFNPLDIALRSGELSWTVAAGLPLTTAWTVFRIERVGEEMPAAPANEGSWRVETAGHFVDIPDGPHAFAAEVCVTNQELCYLVQANRPLRVWLDGKPLLEHDGTFQIPAFHRSEGTNALHRGAWGWRRLVVAVGDGRGGRLFAGVGDRRTMEWLRIAEWR